MLHKLGRPRAAVTCCRHHDSAGGTDCRSPASSVLCCSSCWFATIAPHHAAFLTDKYGVWRHCGGALIRPTAVLSAGECKGLLVAAACGPMMPWPALPIEPRCSAQLCCTYTHTDASSFLNHMCRDIPAAAHCAFEDEWLDPPAFVKIGLLNASARHAYGQGYIQRKVIVRREATTRDAPACVQGDLHSQTCLHPHPFFGFASAAHPALFSLMCGRSRYPRPPAPPAEGNSAPTVCGRGWREA